MGADVSNTSLAPSFQQLGICFTSTSPNLFHGVADIKRRTFSLTGGLGSILSQLTPI